MKTYKCSRCEAEAARRYSYKDFSKEIKCPITDDDLYCNTHGRPIYGNSDPFYYPTIEEYTALRAMYEL